MESLTSTMQKIILHWGEMGSSWGINRTVAQMYALLYISPEPLTADEISMKLSIARSTVSTGLHELQSWGVVKVIHVLGDRRDYFTTMNDIWEVFRVIVAERKRREIDPTIEFLKHSVEEIENQDANEPYVEERLQDMLDFFETVEGAYQQYERVSTDRLKEVFTIGNKFRSIFEQVPRN